MAGPGIKRTLPESALFRFCIFVRHLFRTKDSASRSGRGRRGDLPTRPLTGFSAGAGNRCVARASPPSHRGSGNVALDAGVVRWHHRSRRVLPPDRPIDLPRLAVGGLPRKRAATTNSTHCRVSFGAALIHPRVIVRDEQNQVRDWRFRRR
jgi:hypothetical protein